MAMLREWLIKPLSRAYAPFFKLSRQYHPSALLYEKVLPPRRKITDAEITESFLKGSGPGGQKINKTSSAVQLKHLPTGIVVKSQHTRSREQNRKFARQILGEKLDEMEKGDESRTAIKSERARVKKASRDKKTRRKYRKLAEGKEDDGHDRDNVREEGAQDRGIVGTDDTSMETEAEKRVTNEIPTT